MKAKLFAKQETPKEIKAIRAALIKGEQSGISDLIPDEIMQAVVDRKRKDGTL